MQDLRRLRFSAPASVSAPLPRSSVESQEIAIRMALGASVRHLQSRIFLPTLGLAALGLILEMAASRVLTGALQSLFIGINSADPITFIGMGMLLIAVAAVAGDIPVRRASRIDPIQALRAS
jgi:ABC-type antimicrobial peptide transport system permease subunit